MRKRILFITAFTPSKLGAAVKNTQLMLQDLSLKYEVDLVYFNYNSDDKYIPSSAYINVKEVYLISLMRRLFGFISFPFLHPFFLVRFNWMIYLNLLKLVKKNRYDLMIFDHSQVFLYARLMRNCIPKYLICHDVITQRISRSSNCFFTKIATYSERFVLNARNSSVFSFSSKDCELIYSLFDRRADLCLDYIDMLAESASPTKTGDYFVFFAYWGRRDNIDGLRWFYNHVVPKIDKETEFVIIGKGINTDSINCGNALIKSNIMGFVDNPYNIIANAKALISPLFTGAGIKVKVIEALACGTPVIGTDISFEGFDSKYNKFMLTCKTPDDYIRYMFDIDFSIDERKEFKLMFVDSYKSKTIPNYIDELL